MTPSASDPIQESASVHGAMATVVALSPTSLCNVNGNVAPLGTASQSTTSEWYYASLAIDGDSNPSYYDGSCTHTKTGTNRPAWWSLRLPAAYRVSSVNITNRVYSFTRINNAEIRIGDSTENNGNDNPICAVVSSIPGGATRSFDCGGMIGQYVNVHLNHNNAILSMCEVKVFGDPNVPLFKAAMRGRNVVVVQKKLSWSDALLFCRDFYWDLLSVRSREEQREVEEVLRTASSPLTKHVWLGLRRYVMAGTWFWMSGASVDYSHWGTKTPWQNTSPCGGVDTSGHWKDLPCDHHLHFICLADCPEEDKRVKFFSSTRATEE